MLPLGALCIDRDPFSSEDVDYSAAHVLTGCVVGRIQSIQSGDVDGLGFI